MNRSYNSPLGKSPFSPRTRQSLTGKKLVPSSFRKSSRFSVSGRSTQSQQIILSTPFNYIERFGQPLPVLITEALTFADRTVALSARIARNGFAWLVCGRRLLIWPYRAAPGAPAHTACHELQLSQSDLAHRADLVCVFPGAGAPACMAVSPAGALRYWPSVLHDDLSVEEHLRLDGQECDSLADAGALGCVLATTSSTVLLVRPLQAAGRPAVATLPLRVPTGWLGGLGKRVSSLIFGPNSAEHASETGIVRVLAHPSGKAQNSYSEPYNGSWTIFILADRQLQSWRLTKHEQDLQFVVQLNSVVRDSYRNTIWENCTSDEIDLWFLDLQPDKDHVVILTAAVNMAISPRVHYALIHLDTNQDSPIAKLRDFLILKITDLFREDSNEFLSYRFLISGTYAYLYNQQGITIIKPHEEPDVLEFNANDILLAGAICVNTPIFFTKNHGLVSVLSNENCDLNLTGLSTPVEGSFNELFAAGGGVNNLSLYHIHPDEVASNDDNVAQLKAAFISYAQGQSSYKEIIASDFPCERLNLPGIDSSLDRCVAVVCRDLLDDVPAGDPRWSRGVPIGIGSSSSMQVLTQLENKQKALSILIRFLKDSGLWGRLGISTVRGGLLATIYLVGECMEKIVGARILKSLTLSKTLEAGIKRVVEGEDQAEQNELTDQDLFYCQVSKIQRIFQELANYCEDVCHSNMDPSEVVEIIVESNDVILNVLKEVVKYRKQNLENFRVSDVVLEVAPQFLPWTSSSGNEGLSQYLAQMHFITYNYGIKLTQNDRLRYELLEQLVELTDLLFDGRKSHLESIKGTSTEEVTYKQYCADRQKFMKPFVQEKEWERGVIIAEKYLDFDTLILICDATDNQRRLDEYLERFNDEGFSEAVYNWYLKENKQGKLIERCRKVGSKTSNANQLTNFLSDNPSLSWMQNIFDKRYNEAANTLKQLAEKETESITRQKTMLSLSKLSKLAGVGFDVENYVNEIDSKLELITFQEEIPDYVLQEFGYDTVNIRVIPPKTLIELYISKEYKESSELEFKKALDLLTFIDDEETKQELQLKIWRSALLNDTWNDTNLDSPVEVFQTKLFFRLVDLTSVLDGDVLSLLPSVELLLEDDSVAELRNNAKFQFLIKAGYEHILKSQAG